MGASLFLDMFGRLIPHPLFTFTSIVHSCHSQFVVTMTPPIHNRVPLVFLFMMGVIDDSAVQPNPT
jgi:hypothetical protein